MDVGMAGQQFWSYKNNGACVLPNFGASIMEYVVVNYVGLIDAVFFPFYISILEKLFGSTRGWH